MSSYYRRTRACWFRFGHLVWVFYVFSLPRVGLFVLCLFCVFFEYFLFCSELSVPVQMITWKDSSLKWPIMCRSGHKLYLFTHWLVLFCVVERRRRDKINSWIQQLSQLVPECFADERRQAEVCLTLVICSLVGIHCGVFLILILFWLGFFTFTYVIEW